MLKEQKIKNLNQVEYSYEEFIKILKQYDSEGYDAYIGTDSQVIKNKIYIATCIAFVRRNSRYGSDCSGRVFYVKEKILKKDYPNLRMRMMLEAYRSLEAAMEIEPDFKKTIHIHLDIGPNPKLSKTSAFKVELIGLVASQGYECSIKPEAWCASGVADKVCR